MQQLRILYHLNLLDCRLHITLVIDFFCIHISIILKKTIDVLFSQGPLKDIYNMSYNGIMVMQKLGKKLIFAPIITNSLLFMQTKTTYQAPKTTVIETELNKIVCKSPDYDDAHEIDWHLHCHLQHNSGRFLRMDHSLIPTVIYWIKIEFHKITLSLQSESQIIYIWNQKETTSRPRQKWLRQSWTRSFARAALILTNKFPIFASVHSNNQKLLKQALPIVRITRNRQLR